MNVIHDAWETIEILITYPQCQQRVDTVRLEPYKVKRYLQQNGRSFRVLPLAPL